MAPKSSRSPESPPWAQALASTVKARRRALRLTQRELAELADVGPDFLYDLERGKPTLRLGTVMQVLEALGLNLKLEAPAGGVGVDDPT